MSTRIMRLPPGYAVARDGDEQHSRARWVVTGPDGWSSRALTEPEAREMASRRWAFGGEDPEGYRVVGFPDRCWASYRLRKDGWCRI